MSHQLIVEHTFAAAHAIGLPDGSLEPLHGHNWTISAVVESADLDSIETVMDFHELHRVLVEAVEPVNNRCFNDHPPFDIQAPYQRSSAKLNPTAERIAEWIAGRITPRLPKGVRLIELRLSEAPGCVAVYKL